MTPAAARQRLHRERERRGAICLMVEVPEIELGEQLVEAGLLHRDEVEDRNRLRPERPNSAATPACCSQPQPAPVIARLPAGEVVEGIQGEPRPGVSGPLAALVLSPEQQAFELFTTDQCAYWGSRQR